MTHPTLLWAALLVGQAPPAAERVVVGYLYGPPRDVQFSLYTHLCHAFLVSDAEGNLRPSPDLPSRALARDAHRAGVRVLVSLGGWGYDRQFAAIVSSPRAEDRYVEAVLRAVREADYDGIDIDWEYPDTEAEAAGFERLARRLRAGLDAWGRAGGRRPVLTMAASSDPGTLRWLRPDFLRETMDWVNVMTYDYAGDWTDFAGHNAPLHASSREPGRPRSAEATIAYLLGERKLPADRLALGIPLYGRGFAVAEPYASTKGVAKARVAEPTYRDLVRLQAEGWTRRWDDETKTPWLSSPNGRAVVGYDDAESVANKARWARRKGLRGVFFWQIGGDRLDDGTNPLQEAARRELLAPAVEGRR